MIVTTPDPYTYCPCGSGKKYKFCCRRIPRSEFISRGELAGILSDLSKVPVVSCWLTGNYAESMNLVMAIVVRSLPEGGFLFLDALVDRLFLGVKDCNWGRATSPADVRCMITDVELLPFMPAWKQERGRSASFSSEGRLNLSDEERDRLMEEMDDFDPVDMTAHPVDYEELRSFVLGAVAYAGLFEQPPHPDWIHVGQGFEADRSFEPRFTYGVNGKPLYMSGPYDNLARISRGLARAKEVLGSSGALSQGASPLDSGV